MKKKLQKHQAETSVIAQLNKQIEEKQNLYLRAIADYQNLEKRITEANKLQQKLFQFEFFKHLTELKGDMDKAQAFSQDAGLMLIKNKLEALLKKYGVTELNPLNQPFSPETMECIQTESGPKDNLVTKVFSKGYLFNNELLQPAKVAVSQLEV